MNMRVAPLRHDHPQPAGAQGIKSLTGHKSDGMANYCAQHADQIEIDNGRFRLG